MSSAIKFAATSGGLAVAIGAFGAHALQPHLLEVGRLATFETAVRYQFYHTLALLMVGILEHIYPHKWLSYAARSMAVGIIIFSGSLYTLCLTEITWLGAITPVGGLLFIVGWSFLLVWAWKYKVASVEQIK